MKGSRIKHMKNKAEKEEKCIERENKRLKKHQKEVEREKKRQEKEQAEMKRQASIQRQANIMENFLKRKTNSKMENSGCHYSVKTTCSISSENSGKLAVAATSTIDCTLSQANYLGVDEVWLSAVCGRHPFMRDLDLNYEVDSCEEREEGDPGERLSDFEKDNEEIINEDEETTVVSGGARTTRLTGLLGTRPCSRLHRYRLQLARVTLGHRTSARLPPARSPGMPCSRLRRYRLQLARVMLGHRTSARLLPARSPGMPLDIRWGMSPRQKRRIRRGRSLLAQVARSPPWRLAALLPKHQPQRHYCMVSVVQIPVSGSDETLQPVTPNGLVGPVEPDSVGSENSAAESPSIDSPTLVAFAVSPTPAADLTLSQHGDGTSANNPRSDSADVTPSWNMAQEEAGTHVAGLSPIPACTIEWRPAENVLLLELNHDKTTALVTRREVQPLQVYSRRRQQAQTEAADHNQQDAQAPQNSNTGVHYS
ncbi:hypothetical protein PR202_ga30518 [Eleusine coracana subsp. coracana]|uniref:Uncharacterized protein n=1 Tax=Eleusine coracana subsp. coracana TaxID=191504 RepID=A0AAV5DP71_ELECO|nr:hypothetical protein PR202_ga30484 [Eleusine coracana subsp. coracana]GJN12256.1 hypothetical protein PR202_ga30518 [Eleusine coracana subsp. coracana]